MQTTIRGDDVSVGGGTVGCGALGIDGDPASGPGGGGDMIVGVANGYGTITEPPPGQGPFGAVTMVPGTGGAGGELDVAGAGTPVGTGASAGEVGGAEGGAVGVAGAP